MLLVSLSFWWSSLFYFLKALRYSSIFNIKSNCSSTAFLNSKSVVDGEFKFMILQYNLTSYYKIQLSVFKCNFLFNYSFLNMFFIIQKETQNLAFEINILQSKHDIQDQYSKFNYPIKFIQIVKFESSKKQSMAAVQSDNFKKVVNQKGKKIQWGVTSPVQQSPSNQQKNVGEPQNQDLQQKLEQSQKQKATKKQYISTLNFQNLPIKESQIMGNYQQSTKTQYHTQHLYERKQQATGSQYDKESANRLHQLKNQFEILKGMMIDSRIMQSRNFDKISNMSGSNVYSAKNKPKMGEVIRRKERASKKSKLSSSSASEKDMNLRGSSHLKDRSLGFARQSDNAVHKHRHKYTEIERDEVRGSKISRSKVSQHYSQNPRAERQKISSRVTDKPQNLKVGAGAGGFLSSNLLEKQSLQIQLRNSLEKTQILIQNEILLKTKNHELQQTLRKYLNAGSPKDNSWSQQKIDQLQSKINEYEQRLQNERQSNRQFVERIGKLQAELFANQAMVDLLKQEKNKQSSTIMSMKLNFANLQIQNKRLQMERDIDNRESQFQIGRLKKENQILKSSGANYQRPAQDIRITSYEKDRIRFLQQQLQEKDRRHREMLADLENKKYLKDEAQLMKLVESMHKKKLQEGQGQIGRELKRLKQQIIKIKNQSDLTQSQFGFESKVISLQQALKKDTEDKERYLLEVQRFQRDYEELKTKYKALQAEKDQKQGLIQQHSRAQNKLRLDLQEAQSYRLKYEQSKRQNQDLTIKIQQLQIVIRNYQQIQHEVTQLRQALKKKQNDHNLQIKDARRRVDHAEFQAFKTQQESKFNLDINVRKLSSEIDLANNQLRLMENDRNYHRDQLFGLRQQYEGLVLKVKDMEFNRDQRIRLETQNEIEEKQRVKRQYEQQTNEINQRFFAEEKRLVDQLGNLTRINQQMAESIRRNLILQSQNNQLRALCKRKISTDAAIFHLWEIKQIQYHNVNQILRAVKPSSAALTAKSDLIMRSNLNSNVVAPPLELGVFLPQMVQQPLFPAQPPNLVPPPLVQQQGQNYYNSNQNMIQPPIGPNLMNQQTVNPQINQLPNMQPNRNNQQPKISIPSVFNLDRADSINSLQNPRNEPFIFQDDRAVNFY